MAGLSTELAYRYVQIYQYLMPKMTNQSAPSPRLSILDLPLELVWHIIHFLDPAEITTFSITCKAALKLARSTRYGVIGASVLQRPLQAGVESTVMRQLRVKFLHGLIQDKKSAFFCPNCAKVHSYQSLVCKGQAVFIFNRSLALTQPSTASKHRATLIQGIMTFGPFWPEYAFTYEDARQALSKIKRSQAVSHLPRFAISTNWKLSKLGTHCTNPDAICGYVKLDTEAMVTEGRLIQHTTHRVLLNEDAVVPFFKASKLTKRGPFFKGCCHEIDINLLFYPPLNQLVWSFLDQLNEQTDGYEVADHLSPMALRKASFILESARLEGWDMQEMNINPYILAGCSGCWTETAITIHNHRQSGIEIVFDVFQCLFDGEKPHGKHWQHSWGGNLKMEFQDAASRRLEHGQVHPAAFRTPPGKSLQRHHSAPSRKDIEALKRRPENAPPNPLTTVST